MDLTKIEERNEHSKELVEIRKANRGLLRQFEGLWSLRSEQKLGVRIIRLEIIQDCYAFRQIWILKWMKYGHRFAIADLQHNGSSGFSFQKNKVQDFGFRSWNRSGGGGFQHTLKKNFKKKYIDICVN